MMHRTLVTTDLNHLRPMHAAGDHLLAKLPSSDRTAAARVASGRAITTTSVIPCRWTVGHTASRVEPLHSGSTADRPDVTGVLDALR